MLRIASVAVLAGCLLLAGCAGQSGPNYAFQAEDDRFRPYTSVYSEVMVRQVNVIGSGGVRLSVQLEARKDRSSGARSMHVDLVFNYIQYGKRRYESARDAHARELQLIRVVSNSSGCNGRAPCAHAERVSIEIPEADLRAARSSGYAFKVFTREGDGQAVALTAALVDGFLRAVDGESPAKAVAQKH